MKKRILLFLGLFLALTVWAQGKATAQGEMVSKVDSEEFTYSGSLSDYTLYVSDYGAYYVTDLAGNMLLNVTYTTDFEHSPRKPRTYYYSYDKERVELYHFQRPMGGGETGSGYSNTIRLSDTGFIIYCVNDAWVDVCLNNARYGVQMPAGTKLVSDGETVTILAEKGIKKEVHVNFYERIADTAHYARYIIDFSLDIDTVGSCFHFTNGVLTYSLSREQAFVIKAIKPEMEFYKFLRTQKAVSGTIDLNSEDIIWYATEKEALKNRPDTEEKTITLSWKKVPKAKRYVVYQKTSKGFVKTATVKKCHYTASITEHAVFKIKAQKKVKGRWKTIKTYNRKINF